MGRKTSAPTAGGAKMSYTQVRIDEETFSKGKILAAVYGMSFNALMVQAIRNEVRSYEAQHGPLPAPHRLEE